MKTNRAEVARGDSRRGRFGLFAKGYRASTILDIGRQLGTTSAALYYYFESKQEILSELIGRPIQQLEAMSSEVAGSTLSNQDKLSEIVHRHIEMMLQQRELFTIFLRERVELEPIHAKRLSDLEERYYHTIRNLVMKAQGERRTPRCQSPTGRPGDNRMTNWVLRWYRPDGSLDGSQIAAGLVDVIHGGIFKTGTNKIKPSRTAVVQKHTAKPTRKINAALKSKPQRRKRA